MSISEAYEKLDYRTTSILVGISVVLGLIYGFFISNMVIGIVSLLIAVFGSYFILISFFEEEKPLKLREGEKMILRTLDRAYVMFPKRGGFMTTKSERDLSIYLTSQRVIARRGSGEYVFEKALDSIIKVKDERRIMTRYLRITYLEDGKEKDALFFVGDTNLWLKRLDELGINEIDEFESVEDKKTHIEFTKEAKNLKKRIEKKTKDTK